MIWCVQRGRVAQDQDAPLLLFCMHLSSALHLAVIHDLPDMYDFVMDLADEESDPPENPFKYWTNKERLSPLALAAAMGRVEMFQHILALNTITAWKYGPIACKMVPLLGLEQPQKANGYNGNLPVEAPTAIRCICAGAHERMTQCVKQDDTQLFSQIPTVVRAGRLDLVMGTEVKQLLDNKWEAFAKPIFFQKLAITLSTQVGPSHTLLALGDHLSHNPSAPIFCHFHIFSGGYCALCWLPQLGSLGDQRGWICSMGPPSSCDRATATGCPWPLLAHTCAAEK